MLLSLAMAQFMVVLDSTVAAFMRQERCYARRAARSGSRSTAGSRCPRRLLLPAAGWPCRCKGRGNAGTSRRSPPWPWVHRQAIRVHSHMPGFSGRALSCRCHLCSPRSQGTSGFRGSARRVLVADLTLAAGVRLSLIDGHLPAGCQDHTANAARAVTDTGSPGGVARRQWAARLNHKRGDGWLAGIQAAMLTRTTGHGDPQPQHAIWRAA